MWYPIRVLIKAEREFYEQDQAYYSKLKPSCEEHKEFTKAWNQLLLAIRLLKYIQKKFIQ